MASSDHHHHHLPLPEDALIEILIRLPVKSLLQFKCICKHWYDLIRNPNFAHIHLRFQKRENRGRVFLQHLNPDTKQISYALFPDETLASDAYRDIDYLQSANGLGLLVTDGPVNGLFCLFNWMDYIILWNLAIREFRTLPFPHQNPNIKPYFSINACSIGFGLDPSIDGDDYKVVLIRQFYDDTRELSYVVCVDVYTMTSNTWRNLNSLDYPSMYHFQPGCATGAYLDGVYYWMTGNGVLAFDMGKEVFRGIPTPPILQPLFDDGCHSDVAVYHNDHIAVYVLDILTHSCEIWVMGVEGSWTKQFIVRPIPQLDSLEGFWKNGELLFVTHDSSYAQFDSQLVLYNKCTQEIRDLGPRGCVFNFQAFVYHESLISVEGGMHQRKGKLSDSVAARYFFMTEEPFQFMRHLVEFMRDFRMVKESNTESLFTDLDHKKVRRLLSQVWDSCEYSSTYL